MRGTASPGRQTGSITPRGQHLPAVRWEREGGLLLPRSPPRSLLPPCRLPPCPQPQRRAGSGGAAGTASGRHSLRRAPGGAAGRAGLAAPGPAAPPAGSARRSHGAAAPRQVSSAACCAEPSGAEPPGPHAEKFCGKAPRCELRRPAGALGGGGSAGRKLDGKGAGVRRSALLPPPRGYRRAVPPCPAAIGEGHRRCPLPQPVLANLRCP